MFVKTCQQPSSLSPLPPRELTSCLSEATEDVCQARCLSLATLLSLQSCELSQLLSPKVPPTFCLQGSHIKCMQPKANRCFFQPIGSVGNWDSDFFSTICTTGTEGSLGYKMTSLNTCSTLCPRVLLGLVMLLSYSCYLRTQIWKQ